MIEEKTVYVTRGRQFDSYEKALAHNVDCLGEFMEKLMMNELQLDGKKRMRLIEFMTNPSNRKALIHLLDY